MDIETSNLRFKDWILDKYDHSTIFFLEWYNSFEYICEVMMKRSDEKEKCLLNMINPLNLETIKKKLSPVSPFDLPYDELVNVLIVNFTTYSVKDATDMRLLYRKQLPYETIEHYVLSLRKLYSKCTTAFKGKVSITNIFIEGLADEEIKTHLVKDKKIPLSIAVGTAKQMELAKNKKSGKSFFK